MDLNSRRPARLSTLLLALALLLAPLLALAGAAPALAAPSCVTSGTTVTCTYSYTGAPESWTVPAGVTSATFDLYGAKGVASGGQGGRVTATLAVTAGTTYQILVGGSGNGDSDPGYNGGGRSGTGIASGGYPGGGASDVRVGAFGLADRLLVAGGGGGGRAGDLGRGGDGGFPSGGAGSGGGGGGGGTQTAGGVGGYSGGAGSLGQGGLGASGAFRDEGSGSGGGGGYYGGGGSGITYSGSTGGGGGGGSSYATPAATNVSYQNGVRGGADGSTFADDDGLVIISYSLPDTTAPVASPSQSPAANAGGWNNSAVTVSWNWADNAGGSGIDPASCTTSSTSSGEGAQTLSATCNDLAGNQGSASYSVKVDTTAPAISAAATTDPNASGWYNGDVSVAFTCADALSGVASCPASQTLAGEGASISSTAQTVSDLAGNTSAPSNVVTAQIDRTAPVVSVTGVSDGATYAPGSVPTAACSTSDALSGVATQAGLSSSAGTLGLVTVTCSGATDSAGNAAAAVSVSYRVAYSFLGFFQPVDNLPTVNTANAGRTIPLKWRVLDGAGNPVTNLTSVSVTSVAGGCSAGAPADGVEEYAGTTSGLQNLGDGNYQFNWKTERSWAGSCRTLRLDLGDGVVRTALFQFR